MKKIAFGFILTAITSVSFADHLPVYVFGNTGYNTSKLTNQFEDAKIAESKRAGAIFEIGAGYQFTPNFAIEGAYADLGKNQTKITDQRGKMPLTENQAMQALSIHAVASTQVLPNVSVFAKAGLNYIKAKNKAEDHDPQGQNEVMTSKTHAVLPSVALGAAYKINEKLSVQGEYEYLIGNVKGDYKVENGPVKQFTAFKTKSQNLVKVGLKYAF